MWWPRLSRSRPPRRIRGADAAAAGRLAKADPVIRNLEAALRNNIAALLDNPQTVSELKQMVTNAAQLTAKIDTVGRDGLNSL